MSRIRQEQDWDTVEDWDSQAAWQHVIPDADQVLEQFLTEQELTPLAAADFTSQKLADDIDGLGTMGSRAKVLRVAQYLRNKMKDKKPKMSFHNPLPDSEGLSAIEFVHIFSDWYSQERPPNNQVFDLLRSCASALYADDLTAREQDLKNKPWPEIRDEVLRILDPRMNTAHYVKEFSSITVKENESVEQFIRRFLSYRPQIISMDPENLVKFAFLNALPSSVQNYMQTVTAKDGNENLDELITLLRGRFHNQKDAVILHPSRGRHHRDNLRKRPAPQNNRFKPNQSRPEQRPGGTPSDLQFRSARGGGPSHPSVSNNPRPKCFTCGKTGHLAAHCWSRKRARMDNGASTPTQLNMVVSGYRPNRISFPAHIRQLVNVDSIERRDRAMIYHVAAQLLENELPAGFGHDVSLPRFGQVPTVDLLLGGKQLSAQIDTGAQNSYISYGVLD